jgi:hypothetical protein
MAGGPGRKENYRSVLMMPVLTTAFGYLKLSALLIYLSKHKASKLI